MDAIRNFRRPVTKSDLRSYLGTIGYYRKFIKDYSKKAHPLTEATKKHAPNVLSWSKEMCDAFGLLCNCLADFSVLTLPNESDQFVLYTDASGVGVGAMLSVVRGEQELPVGYFSRKLSPSEKKYSATELECLAIVKAIDHFAVHLWGREFMVVTDHKALQYLDSSKHLNARLTRWALQLQQHSFKTKYRPGIKHGNADGLSRQAWGNGGAADQGVKERKERTGGAAEEPWRGRQHQKAGEMSGTNLCMH